MKGVEEYQLVWITFSDGRKACFVGQAVVREKDAQALRVVDIKFTEPKPLPAGCSFEQMPK